MIPTLSSESFTRFFSKVHIPNSPDSCWIWTAGTGRDGYGQFWYKGHLVAAHRISYEYFHGLIQEGFIVRHKVCNNPICVNPYHLELGTQQDNMDDKVREGRQAHSGPINPARGESNGNSKLSEGDAELIRHLYDNKQMNQYEISAIFEISQNQVSKIVRGLSWIL
ncbi:MAG: HNH endonuclease [Candidatus Izemoplasmatales bacterium]